MTEAQTKNSKDEKLQIKQDLVALAPILFTLVIVPLVANMYAPHSESESYMRNVFIFLAVVVAFVPMMFGIYRLAFRYPRVADIFSVLTLVGIISFGTLFFDYKPSGPNDRIAKIIVQVLIISLPTFTFSFVWLIWRYAPKAIQRYPFLNNRKFILFRWLFLFGVFFLILAMRSPSHH